MKDTNDIMHGKIVDPRVCGTYKEEPAAQHTPTNIPATIPPYTQDGLKIRDNEGRLIADVWCERDAAYIVSAVNAFTKMKTALEAVKRGTEPYDGYIMTLVNQAISQAEKGE